MSKSFQTKLNQDGTKNPKYVDLLEEDKPISGQKFVCLSFLSPEKILKDKKVFFFEEFLKHFDFAKSVRKFTQFLNFLSYKYSLDFDKIMKYFDEYSTSEKGKLLDETTIKDEYQNFLDNFPLFWLISIQKFIKKLAPKLCNSTSYENLCKQHFC